MERARVNGGGGNALLCQWVTVDSRGPEKFGGLAAKLNTIHCTCILNFD
jgi:hypothetical protein